LKIEAARFLLKKIVGKEKMDLHYKDNTKLKS